MYVTSNLCSFQFPMSVSVEYFRKSSKSRLTTHCDICGCYRNQLKATWMLVAGIGIGLFVLIIIWTLTIVAVFVLAVVPKMRYGIPAVVAVTVIISLFLFLYPRESSSVTTVVEGVDEIFFGRLTLLIVLAGFIIAGFVVVFKFHISEPMFAGSRNLHYVTS